MRDFEPTDAFAEAADATGRASAASRTLHRLTEPQLLFPLLALLTLGVLWFATMHLARLEKRTAQQAAIVTTQELLDTYEAQVVRVLREIDQTLKGLEYAFQQSGDGSAALEELGHRDLLPPQLVFSVSVADSRGEIVASTLEAELTAGVAPEPIEQSRAARTTTEADPVRRDGEWWLRFIRPLTGPDGRFGGVGVVEVDASFFVSGYDEGKLGRHGVLGVVGTEGVFRVRRSGDDVAYADSISYASLGTDDGFGETEAVLAVNAWDGVRRYTGARQLYAFPLAVVAGLSEDEQLAAARRRAGIYIVQACFGSLFLLLVLLVLGRLSWKLEGLRRREREYRAAHAARVEHLAYHDSLTGLPNRSFMAKLLDDRIRQSSRYGRQFALLFLDLDGFKQINDTLGHDAGDDLLREVGKRLEDSLRRSDTVARMGGDEFMVLLPEVESTTQASIVARNIIATLGEPFMLLGEKFTVTASVGISIFPADGDDEQTLMKNADIAMYAAKDAGKNSFRYYSPEMSNASQERINLESGLRNALARDEFELHYQARRDLRTGDVTGMEALLRWNHPELGTVGPNKFLPLAEETGLIIPIGRWVLRTACRQNLEWRREGLPRLTVAVNLSARQFFDPNLTGDITAILQEHGMPAELLELEISESVLARDTRRTLPVLEKLKKLGVRITVDNFGTSYSSLSTLGQLPLDTIKIDRLFLREDSGNAVARDLINGILAMGRVLSPSVVAHGVETKEQLDFLRAQVCDQVQGFYFGRPFRAGEVSQMLRAEDIALSAVDADEPVAV